MTGSQYKLDTNISNTHKNNNANSSNQSPPQSSKPQTNPNIYIGKNYKLVYPSDNKMFVFSISQTFIDYGILSPNNLVKRSNTISILSTNPPGYTVKTSQSHNLQSPSSKATIPDTSCDTGTCSESVAALWNNVLSFGFGYNCDNLPDTNSCAKEFYDSKYYKRFPNISDSRDPQVVIEQTKPVNSTGLITYQVNISRTQQEGFYNNIITFIATPNF